MTPTSSVSCTRCGNRSKSSTRCTDPAPLPSLWRKPGADWLFQFSSRPFGPDTSCGCWRWDRKPVHSLLPSPIVGSRRSRPRGRTGIRPDEKNAVSFREAYAQLNVNSNSLAASKNRRAVSALPSVMSLSAARLSPSRPNVERFRVRATGCPSTVAVPIIGPWTDTG